MSRKQFIVYLAILVVIFALGITIGKFLGPSSEEIEKEILSEIEKEILSRIDEQFNRKFEKIPFVPILGEENITSFSGEVTEIDKDSKILKLKVANYYMGDSITEYLASPDFYIIEVKTDENTQIKKTVFPEKLEDVITPRELPSSFEEIEKGRSISVTTEKPFDITTTSKILAKMIVWS
jgi:lipopolysaccharide export LptBFGC system permease protein LptF